MRKILFNLHFFLALLAGVFVVILGVTGSVMAFETELDHLFHPMLSYVSAQPHALSLAELGAAVSKAFPGEPIGAYGLSTSPGISYQVMIRSGVVSINQYTGEVLGIRRNGRDFLSYVHQLHVRLLIRDERDTGKKIMSWAGAAMLLLLLSGLYLWWPPKQLTIRWRTPPRRRWFDLHNSVGILSLLFLLVLAVTGVFIGFEQTTVPLVYQVTRTQPLAIYNRLPDFVIATPPGAHRISPDRAADIARAAIPGASPILVNVPGPNGVYSIASRFPEDRTPGGRSRVYVDPYTGKVLLAEGSRTAPAGSRLITANRAIHTGDIFGMPSKTILSLASLMVVVQAVSGAAMWWKRR